MASLITQCLFFVTVLDKEHFWPKRKISFKLPQKMTTSKPSKIPILHKSVELQSPQEFVNVLTSNMDNKQQTKDSVTLGAVQETSVTTNYLSNSNGGKSIDSGFVDEKNKQKVDIHSLPFTCTTVKVANGEDDSSHAEVKCFMPLEEVDQGITRAPSQGSLVSTVSSTSLEEMVGDEYSSSDCVRMCKTSKSSDSTQLHRPKSACDNYMVHQLACDHKMRRHDSLPQLESSPILLLSKIDLLHNEKVFYYMLVREAVDFVLCINSHKSLMAHQSYLLTHSTCA